MVPYNLMKLNGSAAYLNTGTWSKKAINEAKLFGNTMIVGDSSDKNFNYIPKNYTVPENIDYFHCTSNNTIFGTQIKNFPNISSPMVCDMSSDIFSRKININNFDIIYAGAQKNMGPAGATMVIIKNDILNKTNRDIPTMLNYQTHINKESMFNTPPVFSIYVSMLTLQWLKDKGGIDYIEKINNEKANLLYQEIDRNSLFKGIANLADRSNMNVTFSMLDQEKEKIFEDECSKTKISGIKGHRSVGGYRASIYNAMPIDSIKVLIDVMQKVEKL
jgi:phosphoserine aminotransferase